MRSSSERHDHVAGRVRSAVYDVGREKWRFAASRRSQGPTFRQIGPWEYAAVFVDGEGSPEGQPRSKLRRGTRDDIRKRIPKVVREQPGLTLQKDSLFKSDQLSAAVESTNDATIGDLLAVGAVVDKRHNRKVGVFASAAGLDRRSLRLSWVGRSFFGTESSSPKSDYVSFITGHVQPAFFDGFGGSILQVAFSNDVESWGEILAVRTQGVVSVYQPSVEDEAACRPLRPHDSSSRKQLPTWFKLSHLAEITQEQDDGGTSHLSFHPSNSMKLAVIDSNTKWKIWNLEACRSKFSPREAPLLERHGQVSLPGTSECTADGWARILWTNDGSLFVAASRTQVILLHAITHGVQKSLAGVCTHSNDAYSDWILDVQNCPNSSSDLAILTTRCFMLINIQATGMSMNAEERLHARTVFVIPHQAAAQDLGMRLTLIADRDVVYAILYSSAIADITICSSRKTYNSTDTFDHVVNRQTFRMWPMQNHRQGGTTSEDCIGHGVKVAGMVIMPAVKHADVINGHFANNRNGQHGIFRWFAIMPDQSVASCLVAATENSKVNAWHALSESRSLTGSRASSTTVRDNFVVSDFDFSSDEDSASLPADQLQRREVHRTGSSRHERRLLHYSLRSFGDALHQASQNLLTSAETEEQDAFTLLQRAREELASATRGVAVLSDSVVLTQAYDVSDDLALTIQTLLRETRGSISGWFESEHGSTAMSYALPFSGLCEWIQRRIDYVEPIKIYDVLIRMCISSLQRDIPSHARISLSRASRLAAVQVFLASYAFLQSSNRQDQDSSAHERASRQIESTSEHADGGGDGEAAAGNQSQRSNSNASSKSNVKGDNRVMSFMDQIQDGDGGRVGDTSILSRLGVLAVQEIPERLDVVKYGWRLGYETGGTKVDPRLKHDGGYAPTRLQTTFPSDATRPGTAPLQATRQTQGAQANFINSSVGRDNGMKLDPGPSSQVSNYHDSGLLGSATQPLDASFSYSLPTRPASSSQPTLMPSSLQRSVKRKKAGFR